MYENISSKYNIEYISKMLKVHGKSFIFEGYSKIAFKKEGSCLVHISNFDGITSIHIESVDNRSICILDIDNDSGKAKMYAYDADAGIETKGLIQDCNRDYILKITQLLYEKKVAIKRLWNTQLLGGDGSKPSDEIVSRAFIDMANKSLEKICPPPKNKPAGDISKKASNKPNKPNKSKNKSSGKLSNRDFKKAFSDLLK